MVIQASGCTSAIIEESRRLRARTRENCAKSSAAIRASRATVETTRILVEACAQSPEWQGRRRLHVSGGGHPSAYFSNPLAAISDMLSKSMASSERFTLRRGARVLCHAVGGLLFESNGGSVVPSEIVVALERLDDRRTSRRTAGSGSAFALPQESAPFTRR
jgi:hypothetical protein